MMLILYHLPLPRKQTPLSYETGISFPDSYLHRNILQSALIFLADSRTAKSSEFDT